MQLGVIGAGNMASAIINGILEAKQFASDRLIVSDLDTKKLAVLAQKGVKTTQSNIETVKNSDVVILAVKPNILPIVLAEIAPWVKNTLVISIAAGVKIARIRELLGESVRIIRTMPNLPLMVGEGMVVLSYEAPATKADFEIAETLFSACGKTALIPEKMMDTAVAINGSSPAYVFMMLEAMADAAVLGGIPRDIAYTLAAQSVLGSAKLMLETGKHPGELKDMVCSPGGTTIEAVHQLEKDGFRGAMMNAVLRCAEKSKQLG